MDYFTLASLALSLFLTAGTLWWIWEPLSAPRAAGERSDAQLDLNIQREKLFLRLEDLEQERETGKINEGDYQQEHQTLAKKAAQVLAKMDCEIDHERHQG